MEKGLLLTGLVGFHQVQRDWTQVGHRGLTGGPAGQAQQSGRGLGLSPEMRRWRWPCLAISRFWLELVGTRRGNTWVVGWPGLQVVSLCLEVHLTDWAHAEPRLCVKEAHPTGLVGVGSPGHTHDTYR